MIEDGYHFDGIRWTSPHTGKTTSYQRARAEYLDIIREKCAPRCQDDSCDANHCPRCGCHKLDWYATGLCSRCQEEY
jgi:hypothetical protein